MLSSTPIAESLACNRCHSSLSYSVGPSGDHDIEGILVCVTCGTGVPVIHGFAHFTEAFPLQELETKRLTRLSKQTADKSQIYLRFLQRVHDRGSLDLYAAFQPFNEATRAFFPLLGALEARLFPGDLIVDIWCRTGWTGALLAGMFPKQRVISLWQGPSNVLGYSGFHYWLNQNNRPGNWSIHFADPKDGLPFPTAAARMVHGADCLHRFPRDQLLRDCLRVCRADGAIIFPHVHLNNSQPDPFFERGGTQLHGDNYRVWLKHKLKNANRQVFVLDETKLFADGYQGALVDDSRMSHYNALIAVISGEAELGPAVLAPTDDCFLISNPMVSVDQVLMRATRNVLALSGQAGHLLARHPVYEERLTARLPAIVDDTMLKLLYWGDLGVRLSTIKRRLALDDASFHTALARLQEHELAIVAPVGQAAERLQKFYVTREIATPIEQHQFSALWQSCREIYGSTPLLMSDNGPSFNFEEANEVVLALARLFKAKGVDPEHPLVLVTKNCAEAIFAVWAAWIIGAVVAPLDPNLPSAHLATIIDQLNPALVLGGSANRSNIGPDVPFLVIGMSPSDMPSEIATLVDALEPYTRKPETLVPIHASDEDRAILLFTSGSTGAPKGVPHSHGAVYRSARALSQVLGWRRGDVLLSLGNLHTMSGLRNPCAGALMAGATIYVPEAPDILLHPAATASACLNRGVTLITGTPAFLSLSLAAGRHRELRFGPVRQIAVTGSTLPLSLQHEFERRTSIDVQVYYGLTETGGICAATLAGMRRSCDSDVGVPIHALLRIVDEKGQRVLAGETGELQVYSANLCASYLNGDQPRFDRGWLCTGDIAKFDRGHLLLTGRRDNQVKNRHGEIVHLEVLEAALLSFPKVLDAAAVSVGDAPHSQIVAFVVPRAEGGAVWLELVQRHLLSQLGKDLAPDRLFELEVVPRTESGKISREDVRDISIEKLNGLIDDPAE